MHNGQKIQYLFVCPKIFTMTKRGATTYVVTLWLRPRSPPRGASPAVLKTAASVTDPSRALNALVPPHLFTQRQHQPRWGNGTVLFLIRPLEGGAIIYSSIRTQASFSALQDTATASGEGRRGTVNTRHTNGVHTEYSRVAATPTRPQHDSTTIYYCTQAAVPCISIAKHDTVVTVRTCPSLLSGLFMQNTGQQVNEHHFELQYVGPHQYRDFLYHSLR